MEKLEVVLNDRKEGEVQIFDGDVKSGLMVISIESNRLTVYHTEVGPQFEGKGYAKMLLEKLVSYAREHDLKIVPLCPFVHAQFRRHPDLYKDVWYRPQN